MSFERCWWRQSGRRMSVVTGGSQYSPLPSGDGDRDVDQIPLVNFSNSKVVTGELKQIPVRNTDPDVNTKQCRRSCPNRMQRVRTSSRSSIDMRTNWDSSGMYKWRPPTWKVKLLIVLCGLVIVAGVGLILHYHSIKSGRFIIGDGHAYAEIVLSDKSLRFVDGLGLSRLSIVLGGDSWSDFNLNECKLSDVSATNVCLSWENQDIKLCVSQMILEADIERIFPCFNVSWSSNIHFFPEDCVQFDSTSIEAHSQPVWYDTLGYVLWPRLQESTCEHVCHDYTPTAVRAVDIGGTVVEPLWLSSQGTVVRASLQNHMKACLRLCKDALSSNLCLKPSPSKGSNVKKMSYSVCFGTNLTSLHSHVISKIVMKEATDIGNQLTYQLSNRTNHSIIDECTTLLHKPLWNIALRDGGYKNESQIIRDLSDFSTIGGTALLVDFCNVFENVGDFVLTDSSHLNITLVIAAMHKMNLSVMLPISPFVNYDSNSFKEALDNEFLLENELEKSPVLINAERLNCDSLYPGIVDFTNPKSFQWFVEKAKKFTDTFKIDFLQLMYGQTSWLPTLYSSHKNLTNRGLFSTLFTNTAQYISPCPVTDIAYASQDMHQLVILKPGSGLKETLRMALASGLAGYPFFIPNLPFKLSEVEMLTSENLVDGFIRWIQLVSFFPVMHIPWDTVVMSDRNMDTVRLTDMIKKCLNIRSESIVKQAVETAFHQAVTDRSLFISPMWMAPMLSPQRETKHVIEEMFLIDDQFMIGNDLIIAPILEMEVRSRDVFLPAGRWARLGKPDIVFTTEEKHWIKGIEVPLDDILIFFRISV